MLYIIKFECVNSHFVLYWDICVAMASAHSMSMFSLPFSNSTELAVAYKVYFVVCISGACVGLFGAAIFLYRLKSEETTITRRRMLILLGVSDLLADMGTFERKWLSVGTRNYIIFWRVWRAFLFCVPGVIVKSAYWLIGTANVANSGRPLPVLVGGAVLEVNKYMVRGGGGGANCNAWCVSFRRFVCVSITRMYYMHAAR